MAAAPGLGAIGHGRDCSSPRFMCCVYRGGFCCGCCMRTRAQRAWSFNFVKKSKKSDILCEISWLWSIDKNSLKMFLNWLAVCWANNTHIVRGHVRTSKLSLQQAHLIIMSSFEQKWLYLVPAQPPPPPLISQPGSERIVVSRPLLSLLVVKWRWFFAFSLVWFVSFCFVSGCL